MGRGESPRRAAIGGDAACRAPPNLIDLSINVLRRVFAAALITTTVRERHPRSHHKGATGRV